MSNDRAGRNSHTDVIRTFICIDVSASIKARLAALQDDLRKLDAQVSWVKPENIHLTLKFLSDVPQSEVPKIIEAISRATNSCSPFPVEVEGAGCFPSPRKPNVLWVGFAPLPKALVTLQKNIEDEMERVGFAREAKSFKPHLTIGRVRQPRNAQLLAEELLKRGFPAETCQADEVIFMRSELTPRGAIYTPLAKMPLPSS